MKIAIIGCGNMGSGMATRLSPLHTLYLYDRHSHKIEALTKKGFGKRCENLQTVIEEAEMVILAIKPQGFLEAAQQITEFLKPSQIIVSLLSGISIDRLQKTFPKNTVLRMMPNLPLIYGEGVIGMTTFEHINTQIKQELTSTFESLGKILWLTEKKLEALSALSGSGPAFIFVIIEACIEAGIAMGFDAKSSSDIVLQTIKGSVCLLEESGKHPAELKWGITSPGGTTIQGLRTMEAHSVRSGIMNTFLKTYETALEMSEKHS